MDKNEFEYCRRIKDLDDSLIFKHKQYYCYGTRVQISGILPLLPPYRVGAYWDDIAYLAAMSLENSRMALLGAGLLSFAPLLKSLIKHNFKIDCVDINEDILIMAEKIQQINLNPTLKLNYLSLNVLNLPPEFFKELDLLFIDIYDEFSISPIAVDPIFLNLLKNNLKSSSVLAANINDPSFSTKKKCATRLFYETIANHWENILLARRSSSTTVFFSRSKSVKEMKAELLAANLYSKKDYHFVDDASLIFSRGTSDELNLDLLKFNDSFEKNVLEKDTLLFKVIGDLQQLSNMDLLKLLKKGKNIEI